MGIILVTLTQLFYFIRLQSSKLCPSLLSCGVPQYYSVLINDRTLRIFRRYRLSLGAHKSSHVYSVHT